MGIHSKILVHWTGEKDIEKEADEDKPRKYVERLRDDLENGLYVGKSTEKSLPPIKVKHLRRICFTEIRLSQAQTHASRYGGLGIGFTRDFIMDKGGRPVIYIPHSSRPDGRLLEDSIRYFHENRNKENEEARKAAVWILAHVKIMSNGAEGDCREDYYEEMEWRLVQGGSQKCFEHEEEGSYAKRLRFKPSDVKVIVFQDVGTKQLALEDDFIRKYFSDHVPIMATLEECDSF